MRSYLPSWNNRVTVFSISTAGCGSQLLDIKGSTFHSLSLVGGMQNIALELTIFFCICMNEPGGTHGCIDRFGVKSKACKVFPIPNWEAAVTGNTQNNDTLFHS